MYRCASKDLTQLETPATVASNVDCGISTPKEASEDHVAERLHTTVQAQHERTSIVVFAIGIVMFPVWWVGVYLALANRGQAWTPTPLAKGRRWVKHSYLIQQLTWCCFQTNHLLCCNCWPRSECDVGGAWTGTNNHCVVMDNRGGIDWRSGRLATTQNKLNDNNHNNMYIVVNHSNKQSYVPSMHWLSSRRPFTCDTPRTSNVVE